MIVHVSSNIQCQRQKPQTSSASSAEFLDSHEKTHISLCRPHTVMFHSTTAAYDSTFLSVLAEELLRADGKIDIFTMFTFVLFRMKTRMNYDAKRQHAVCVSTLDKHLVLPPPATGKS